MAALCFSTVFSGGVCVQVFLGSIGFLRRAWLVVRFLLQRLSEPGACPCKIIAGARSAGSGAWVVSHTSLWVCPYFYMGTRLGLSFILMRFLMKPARVLAAVRFLRNQVRAWLVVRFFL